MKKSLIAMLLVPLGLVLSTLASPLTEFLKDWRSHHEALAIFVGIGVVGIAMTLAYAKEQTGAKATGDPIPISQLVGSVLASIAFWGTVGAVIGWLVEKYFVYINAFLGSPDPFSLYFAKYITEIGPVGVARVLVGAAAGTRFGNIYPKDKLTLSFIGILVGAALGNATRDLSPQLGAFAQLSHMGAASLGAAILGASIAAVTGLFRPSCERWEREQKAAEKEKLRIAKEPKRTKTGDIARIERAAIRIRDKGYTVKWGVLVDSPLLRIATTLGESFVRSELDKGPELDPNAHRILNDIKMVANSFAEAQLPCVVQDAMGAEMGKFDSVEGLEQFAAAIEAGEVRRGLSIPWNALRNEITKTGDIKKVRPRF